MNKANRFEMYPKLTLLFLVLFMCLVWLATDIIYSVFFSEKLEQFRVQNNQYHHGFRKNIDTYEYWGKRKYKIYTNSISLKDSSNKKIDIDTSKYRYLFIGDSFTEGVGIEYSKTFVGIIDNHISKSEMEVLNAGVSSYSPIFYYHKLNYFLNDLKLKVDEIIVCIDISDMQDEGDRPSYKPSDVEFIYSNDKSFFETYLVISDYVITSLGVLYNEIVKPENDKINELEFENNKEKKSYARYAWTFDEKIYRAYLRNFIPRALKNMEKVVLLTREHNIELTIVVYPWKQQIIEGDIFSKQVQIYESFSKEYGVNFINLFPAFLKNKDDISTSDFIQRHFIEGDVHWNERGHELVASEMILEMFGD